jgi:hypothetical protein
VTPVQVGRRIDNTATFEDQIEHEAPPLAA